MGHSPEASTLAAPPRGAHALAATLTHAGIGRLRLGSRLALLVAALLVPTVVGVWSFVGVMGDKIAFSAAERDGVVVTTPALAAMTQAAAGSTVALDDLTSAVAAQPQLKLGDTLGAVTALGTAATPDAHLRLTQSLSDLVTAAGNSSNLILDPDLDSFYVMDLLVVTIPKALVAASSTAVPATGDAATQIASGALVAGQLSAAASTMRSDVSTALSATKDPKLADRLSGVAAAATALEALSAKVSGALGTGAVQDQSAAVAAVAAVVAPASAGLDALLTTRIAGFQSEQLRTVVIAVLAALVALAWAVAVVWGTRADVGLALRGVRALADGDLTPQPMPTGRDELGDVGRGVDSARAGLADMIRRLARAVELVNDATLRMREAATAVDGSATRTLELSEAAAVELDQVTAMVGAVSAAGQQVSTATGEIAMTMAGLQMQAVATQDELDDAVRLTSALDDSSRSITRTVEAIAAVAQQTRMLALNATIEAASAGAAGRGFAVVADEVKDLAATSRGASTEIGTVASAQQAEIARVVEAIARTHAAMEQANSAQSTVVAAAEEQRAAMSEMASSLDLTAGAAQRIDGEVRTVEEVARGTRIQVVALDDAARTLTDLAKDLSGQVRAFRV